MAWVGALNGEKVKDQIQCLPFSRFPYEFNAKDAEPYPPAISAIVPCPWGPVKGKAGPPGGRGYGPGEWRARVPAPPG